MKIVLAILIGSGLGFLLGSIMAVLGVSERHQRAFGAFIMAVGAILILVSFT